MSSNASSRHTRLSGEPPSEPSKIHFAFCFVLAKLFFFIILELTKYPNSFVLTSKLQKTQQWPTVDLNVGNVKQTKKMRRRSKNDSVLISSSYRARLRLRP